METQAKTDKRDEIVRLALEATQKISQVYWGPDGPPPGTDIDLIEDFAVLASHLIFDGVIAKALEMQNDGLPQQLDCPDCGTSCPVRIQQRKLLARKGHVTIPEPVCFCPDCNRDFFPSSRSASPR